MFKKIALIGLVALSSQLQVYAASCDVPVNKFKWVHAGTKTGKVDFCPPNARYNNKNCIVQWNGFGWWSNFHANPSGFFYEAGQSYNPLNVTADDKGLKLTLRKYDMGGPAGANEWTAAEAVLVSQGGGVNNDGSPVNIGYGHYLFTYELPVPTAQMDPSTVFGAFTYYRQNIDGVDQGANPNANNLKELDMIEHSKWGWNGVGDCPFTNSILEPYGCSGSAQFGAQPWEQAKQANNLKRFAFNSPNITNNEKVFTVYMYWEDANKPVIYKIFTGKTDMATAKTKPGNAAPDFTMDHINFVPSLQDKDKNGADACVRFHFNFYSAINSSQWAGNKNVNIYPKSDAPISVYITNFEYQPK